MGVILHGTREQRTRQELQKVIFDRYDGAIGFVNIRNVHWKFVYVHALSNHISCGQVLLFGFSVKLVEDGFTRSASE
ncbi:hypothetical protein CesoFtcFv8_008079 [Champsocephalus esox]|uniref:Uncharacterized protein n=1 Tax=Champsocephalus esox TaxID=159716 RepID=A0AAN8CK23_9TELE|nr:hypothetical protein CesoFtcFv8_008079 [Champsocephalus esox]